MANPEHLAILKQGVRVWNQWRHTRPNEKPDLSRAIEIPQTLEGINLRSDGLYGASLSRANLQGADLSEAKLKYAWLNGADLRDAKFIRSDMIGAKIDSIMDPGNSL